MILETLSALDQVPQHGLLLKFRTADIFTTNFVSSLYIKAFREVFPIDVRSPEISEWDS